MIKKGIDLLKLRNTKAKDVERIGSYEIRIVKDLCNTMFSGPNYVGFQHLKLVILSKLC